MAKQAKAVAARRTQGRPEDSLLLRSAESLGRVIGTLQRQLETATRQALSSTDGSGDGAPRRSHVPLKTKPAARAKAADSGRRRSGGSDAAKTRSTSDRKSKRAAKSSAAKKTAGGRSGGRKTAAKKK